MRRPLALILLFMMATMLFVALAAGTASANIIATIPLNKTVEVTPGMYAHLMEINVHDITQGGSYAPDPSKVIYPVLIYQYENHGSVAQSGHLHVHFIDDQGDTYDGSDPGTMETIKPGGTSSVRPIEINIPKDRKLVRLNVIMGFGEEGWDLSYTETTATPTATPGTSGTPSASPKGSLCLGLVLLPLLVVGAAWIGKRAIKK